MQKLRNKSGFTLIEILLVFIVIALLLGLSVPTLKNSFQHYELHAAVSNFEKTVSYARQHAVLENHVLRLELDSDKHVFFLYQLNPVEDKKTFEPVELQHHTFAKSVQCHCNAQDNQIWFYPDGSHTSFSCQFEKPGVQKITISSHGTMARLTHEEQRL